MISKIKLNFLRFKSYLYEDKRIFAKGVSGTKLFLIFVFGSIIGTYYEQILNLITHFINNGSFFWEYRRGVIYGPFSPVYGAGLTIITLLLVNDKDKWSNTFLKGAFIGGGFEYLISFLQEKFVGTVSWDYTDRFLNINGRTTILYMIGWGLAALIFVKFIYPIISKFIERIPYNLGKIITMFLVVFLVLDMFISWTALLRQTLRRNGYGPISIVGEFYDTVYNDDYLKKHFPNMLER